MNPMSFTGLLKGGAQLLWLMTITNSNVMQGNYLVMSLSIKGLNPAAAPAGGPPHGATAALWVHTPPLPHLGYEDRSFEM